MDTVGKVLLVQEIRRQVLPTAPSPTVTHLINVVAAVVVVDTDAAATEADIDLRYEDSTL